MDWERVMKWLHWGFFLALILVFLHEYPNVLKAHELVNDSGGFCLIWDESCTLMVADRLYNTAFARLSVPLLGLMVTDRAFVNAFKLIKRGFEDKAIFEDEILGLKWAFAWVYVIGFFVGAVMLIKNFGWVVGA